MNSWTSVLRQTFLRALYPLASLQGPVRVILMYHAVGEDLPQSVGLDRFRRHLEMIRERFTVCTLNELGDRHRPPETDRAVLTFDDGYRSHHEKVVPVLESLDLKGCFFIPTGLMGESLQTWSGPVRLMEESQVRDLSQRGHEVGGHAVSHQKLTTLSRRQLRDEIRECKTTLEELTGQAIDSFAYPKGDCDQTVKETVRRAGFRRAVGVQQRLVTPDSDSMLLPRVWVHNGLSSAGLRARMSRALHWYSAVRDRVKDTFSV